MSAPTDSLSRGTDTFTLDRLDAILKNERFSYDYRDISGSRPYSHVHYEPPSMRVEIDTSFWDSEQAYGEIRFFNSRDTKLRVINFCQELYDHGTPAPISVARLDTMFSEVFKFKFEPLEDSQAIIERASDLLERMPRWPLELDDIPIDVPSKYRASSIASRASRDARLWEQLETTTFVSRNVLRVALSAVMDPGCIYGLLDTVNIIAGLLEIIAQSASTDTNDETFWRLFIVRAFLWTSWQRCQMIYFHLIADSFLVNGSSDGKLGHLTLRGTLPSPRITIQELSRQRASLEKAAYMCGWNFELLRMNSICIGADFRRFHQRYNTAFGNYPARCLAGQTNACKGDSPKSCQRFQGMVIEDQSQHDQGCFKDCRQLIWDETSYRSISGARAVSLAQPQDYLSKSWTYCNASDKTLAISHVWSHGQGGRPETGFNNCLHLRYSRIAISLGCDSYWIDATCIPDDHQLRAESISKINEVFMNAKVMLMCDKDIIELNISNMTTAICETLLVTAIVCDWNVRAWTFFEAFRARRTIHLLCKNNAVVPLKRVIETIHHKGALEIGILLLAMPHFLPPLDDRELASPKSESREAFKAGYLPVETSGSLLSHRAASREGDDFVIWSLLMTERTIFNNAEAFWKSMQGLAFQNSAKTGRIFSDAASIKIGYLVSSAPRIKTRGLGWAPASPSLHLSTKTELYGINGYDGGPSESGYITTDGLVADWLLCRIDGTGLWSMISSTAARLGKRSESQYPRNFATIRSRYLQGYRWGAILLPLEEQYRGNGRGDGCNWWEEGSRSRRTILVVCGTNEPTGSVVEKYIYNSSIPTKGKWDENGEAVGWEWRGIYVWDNAEPLPSWHKARKLLII